MTGIDTINEQEILTIYIYIRSVSVFHTYLNNKMLSKVKLIKTDKRNSLYKSVSVSESRNEPVYIHSFK